MELPIFRGGRKKRPPFLLSRAIDFEAWFMTGLQLATSFVCGRTPRKKTARAVRECSGIANCPLEIDDASATFSTTASGILSSGFESDLSKKTDYFLKQSQISQFKEARGNPRLGDESPQFSGQHRPLTPELPTPWEL